MNTVYFNENVSLFCENNVYASHIFKKIICGASFIQCVVVIVGICFYLL